MPQPSVSPTPTPSPADPAHAVLHGVVDGVAGVMHQAPWAFVLLGLVMVSALVRSARVAIHSGPKDPQRTFSSVDKRTLLARAGDRCEHHGPIGGRCRATERLEADHVHPHSRGGWTHLSNGQILCKAHNREKRADIPWNRTLRRLAEHRAAYYPADVDPFLVHREHGSLVSGEDATLLTS